MARFRRANLFCPPFFGGAAAAFSASRSLSSKSIPWRVHVAVVFADFGGAADDARAIVGESDDEKKVPVMPDNIEGRRAPLVHGKHSSGWNYHQRWKISCPEHGCTKSRSTVLDREAWGPEAASKILEAMYIGFPSTHLIPIKLI